MSKESPQTWFERNRLQLIGAIVLLLLVIAAGITLSREASTPSAIPAVTTNSQWIPQTQIFNGVEMVLVPPGCFNMGSENGKSSESPVTKICFDRPFWIDKYEVTQAQFKMIGGVGANRPSFTEEKLPVANISWIDARIFCAKRDARLPTEAEWEYAARGPDDLIYPWGNTFDGSKVVYHRSLSRSNTNTVYEDETGAVVTSTKSPEGPAVVSSLPAGTSWVGALDMSGNVWEWTSSLYQAYPYKTDDGRESSDNTSTARVFRGGSWDDTAANDLRSAFRGGYNPSASFNIVGFRCARPFNQS